MRAALQALHAQARRQVRARARRRRVRLVGDHLGARGPPRARHRRRTLADLVSTGGDVVCPAADTVQSARYVLFMTAAPPGSVSAPTSAAPACVVMPSAHGCRTLPVQQLAWRPTWCGIGLARGQRSNFVWHQEGAGRLADLCPALPACERRRLAPGGGRARRAHQQRSAEELARGQRALQLAPRLLQPAGARMHRARRGLGFGHRAQGGHPGVRCTWTRATHASSLLALHAGQSWGDREAEEDCNE